MATTVLSISPNSFTASAGKLVSTTRYIRKSSNPLFYLINGKNMDVSGGGLRYVSATGNIITDNTYNGAFSSVLGTGVKI